LNQGVDCISLKLTAYKYIVLSFNK